MVQWFLPGFLACIQRFETRLTSVILLDAGMSWRVQDLYCAAGRFDSIPVRNLVVFHRDLSSNVNLKSYDTQFSVSYEITYQFLRMIQDVVDARELKHERGPTYLKSC